MVTSFSQYHHQLQDLEEDEDEIKQIIWKWRWLWLKSKWTNQRSWRSLA